MILAIALLGYACLLGFLLPRYLSRASIASRHPGLGIALWQSTQLGFVLALLLAAAALALPALSFGEGPAHLRAMAGAVADHLAHDPQRHPEKLAGLLAGVTITIVLGWTWLSSARRAARIRREHRLLLALVCTPHLGSNAVVLDSEVPTAYCLAGNSGTVVVTSAALGALSAAELAAVLAHEEAHLRGRHHWIKQWAEGFARAFAWLPLARIGRDELACLVEMAADDAAVRRVSTAGVVSALMTMGSASQPTAGLAANSGVTTERVRRLVAGPRSAPRWLQALALSFAFVTALAPAGIAVSPGLVDTAQHCSL